MMRNDEKSFVSSFIIPPSSLTEWGCHAEIADGQGRSLGRLHSWRRSGYLLSASLVVDRPGISDSIRTRCRLWRGARDQVLSRFGLRGPGNRRLPAGDRG